MCTYIHPALVNGVTLERSAGLVVAPPPPPTGTVADGGGGNNDLWWVPPPPLKYNIAGRGASMPGVLFLTVIASAVLVLAAENGFS